MNVKVKKVRDMLYDILVTKGVEVDDRVVIERGFMSVTKEDVVKMYNGIKVVHDADIREAWKLLSYYNEYAPVIELKFFRDIKIVHKLGLLLIENHELADAVKIAIDGIKKKVVNMRDVKMLNHMFELLIEKEFSVDVDVIEERTFGLDIVEAIAQIFKVGDPVVNYKTVAFKYMMNRVKREVQEQRQTVAGVQGPSKKFIANIVYNSEVFYYKTMLWRWIVEEAKLSEGEILAMDVDTSRDIELWKAEWLMRSLKKSDYMTRMRVEHGPNGEEYRYTMMATFDEIQPVDLVNGINTSARVVCERCIERRRHERHAQWIEDYEPVPNCPVGDHPEIEMFQIKTPADIVMEGKVMNHCVGDYAGAAKVGRTFIYHVGEKAPSGYTVEIRFNEDGTAWIRQAFGYKNCTVDYSAVKKIVKKYNKNINRRG